ncbi:MAG: Xaa-Pro dipeptidyl-peptidase [Flavobacteriaceae bacterium]
MKPKLFASLCISIAGAYLSHAQTTPVFENGLAQIVEEFKDPSKWIKHDLWVETEFDTDGDGALDRMHVSVIRPEQTETEKLKLPVIYNTSPYFAGVAADTPGAFWDVNHELGETPPPHKHPSVTRRGKRPVISQGHSKTWIPRGYIMVYSSSPGTGLSDGSPTVGGTNESLAPKAVIEWLSGKDNGYLERTGTEKTEAYWSTGKVGMTGTSYNGTLPLAAATTGVEALKVIIPIAPNTSYYHYYRSNGLVRSPGGYLGEDVDVLYDFIHSGDVSKRAYADRVVRDGEMAEGMDRESGDYNDFWFGRDYLNQMQGMKAAMLMSHGFNDWNVMPEHSYRIYKAAEEKGLITQIYYHQRGHGGPPPVAMMNKWFSQFLFDQDNGIENEEYKAHIVREYDKASEPTAYANYPNPEASNVSLYLKPGAPKVGSLSLEASNNSVQEVVVDNYSFSGETLAQAEITDHRLLYLSPILKEDLHLSGLANIKIKVASSKPAANLSVWLVSLPWNSGRNVKITDNIITRGWADPQNAKSLSKSKALKPGKFVNLSFDLQPDDQIIHKGQQIGLMIFSSDKNYTLHPEPGTKLTIDLGETVLSLPVVGGMQTFENSIK